METELPQIADRTQPGLNVESLKKGDKRAFAQFVNHYQGMVFACCRAAGLGREDTEDAAAETFLAVYQSIRKFNGKSKLSSWLWTIAYRKALDVRARNSKKSSLNDAILEVAASSGAPASEDSLETAEQGDVIWDAVQRLPQNWAAAIVLFYREDKAISEIAEILHIPSNTVKTYLDRGRKKLYDLLGKYWENDYVKL